MEGASSRADKAIRVASALHVQRGRGGGAGGNREVKPCAKRDSSFKIMYKRKE